MGHQDWGPDNPFSNPKPAEFFRDIYHFEAVRLSVRDGMKETAANAKSALRKMNRPFPKVASAPDLHDAAIRLRTAAHWAAVGAWKPAEGQNEIKAFPELKMRVEARQFGDRVEYHAESTWNVSGTGVSAREAVDDLLDQIMPRPSDP